MSDIAEKLWDAAKEKKNRFEYLKKKFGNCGGLIREKKLLQSAAKEIEHLRAENEKLRAEQEKFVPISGSDAKRLFEKGIISKDAAIKFGYQPPEEQP